MPRKKKRASISKEHKCGVIKPDGSRCIGTRVHGTERCRWHQDAPTPAPEEDEGTDEIMPPIPPPTTFRELTEAMTEVFNRHNGKRMSTKRVNAASIAAREILKSLMAQKRYDPKEIAERKISSEMAAKAIREMPIDMVRKITRDRDFGYLEAEVLKITALEQPVLAGQVKKEVDMAVAELDEIEAELLSDSDNEKEEITDAVEEI